MLLGPEASFVIRDKSILQIKNEEVGLTKKGEWNIWFPFLNHFEKRWQVKGIFERIIPATLVKKLFKAFIKIPWGFDEIY